MTSRNDRSRESPRGTGKVQAPFQIFPLNFAPPLPTPTERRGLKPHSFWKGWSLHVVSTGDKRTGSIGIVLFFAPAERVLVAPVDVR